MSIRGIDDYHRMLSELCSLPSNDIAEQSAFKVSYICGVLLLAQHSTFSSESALHWACIFRFIVAKSAYKEWNDVCKGYRAELVQLRYPSNNLYDCWLYKKLWIGLKKAFPSLPLVPDSPEFLSVLNFCGWLNRLPVDLPPVEDEYSDYLIRDLELDNFFYQDYFVEPLRAIAQEWFGEFSLDDDYRPRLSSGSTADAGRPIEKKYKLLGAVKTSSLLTSNGGSLLWYSASTVAVNESSRVCAVPKQLGKNRIICMEPASLVAHQLGLSRSILRFIDESGHPIKRMLDIRDQEVNRNLVRHGLRDGLATIDLSNASDSVSWYLIRRVFAGLPLLRYLYSTRTSSYTMCGNTYGTRKFAPMGSGMCFLIESIFFCLVLEFIRRYGSCNGSTRHHGWSVYGDDLIVPSAAYQDVVDTLEGLGFTINKAKSFFEGPYRESCGIECIDDIELKTIRHPRAYLVDPTANVATRHMMLVDLLNSLGDIGYLHTRRYLISELKLISLPASVRRLHHQRSVFDLLLSDSSFKRRNNTFVTGKWQRAYQRYVYPRYNSKLPSLKEDDLLYSVWLMNVSSKSSRKERLGRALGYFVSNSNRQPEPVIGITVAGLGHEAYLVKQWSPDV